MLMSIVRPEAREKFAGFEEECSEAERKGFALIFAINEGEQEVELFKRKYQEELSLKQTNIAEDPL